jgi:hypothetical protein
MIRSTAIAFVLAAGVSAAILAPARAAGARELHGGEFRTAPQTSGGASCREVVRIFDTLRDGDFDFCRKTLGYVPGKRDCLRAVTTVCSDWVLADGVWQPQELVDSRTVRIPCPPGPVPPSCPSELSEPLD